MPLKLTKKLDLENKFWRKPLVWELWTVIKNAPLQTKPEEYTADYIVINDYTCDTDRKGDVLKIQEVLYKKEIGGDYMIKCEVIEPFTLERFNELTNIVRANIDTPGQLNVGDTFNCKKDMADYLLGGNRNNIPYVKIIEVIPDKKEESDVSEYFASKKTKNKKTTR